MEDLLFERGIDICHETVRMDFVSDALFDERRLRALAVVDAFTGEGLAIDVDQGIKSEQVVETMVRISSIRRVPRTIRVDNGLGVYLEGARPLGVREWRDAGLQSTG